MQRTGPAGSPSSPWLSGRKFEVCMLLYYTMATEKASQSVRAQPGEFDVM
jgi:hypothetical protein